MRNKENDHENDDPKKFSQPFSRHSGGSWNIFSAGRDRRSVFCHSGRAKSAGRSLSLRISARDHECNEDLFDEYRDSQQYQSSDQPVQPCKEAGRCIFPHGGDAQCGYHLHTGMAGSFGGTDDLCRSGDRPLLQCSGSGCVDEYSSRSGRTGHLCDRPLRLAGNASRRCPEDRSSYNDRLDDRPYRSLWNRRPAECLCDPGADAADAAIDVYIGQLCTSEGQLCTGK